MDTTDLFGWYAPDSMADFDRITQSSQKSAWLPHSVSAQAAQF